MNFLHTYHPDPIIFSIGSMSFYWYGFFISTALLVGIILAQKIGEKYNIKKEEFFNFSIFIIIFSLIGARIYYIFLELDYFIKYPINVFKFYEGGLAIHGGILGGLISGYYYIKKRSNIYKLKFLLIADIVAVSLALGQSIGRWGNYFNQELYGLPTKFFLGIPIDSFHRDGYFNNSAQYFHPVFLYESILNFCNFLFLLFLHKKKNNIKNNIFLKNGNIFLVYLLNYSVIRFTMEFIRIDETALVFGARVPQVLSVLLFIFIVVILIYRTNLKFKK